MKHTRWWVIASMLALTLVFAACGGGDDGGGNERDSVIGECPNNSDAQAAAGQTVFQNTCAACHAGYAQPGGRAGVPPAAATTCSNLATVADCMYHRALEGEMPPAPMADLSDQQVEDLRVWLACNQ